MDDNTYARLDSHYSYTLLDKPREEPVSFQKSNSKGFTSNGDGPVSVMSVVPSRPGNEKPYPYYVDPIIQEMKLEGQRNTIQTEKKIYQLEEEIEKLRKRMISLKLRIL